MFSSLGLLTFLIKVKPYSDQLLNAIEIFNESSILALSYFMFMFTDLVPDPYVRYQLGWFFSAIIALNISLNWIVLFWRLLKPLGGKIKVMVS